MELERTPEQIKDELILLLEQKIEKQETIIQIQKTLMDLKDQKIALYKDYVNATPSI